MITDVRKQNLTFAEDMLDGDRGGWSFQVSIEIKTITGNTYQELIKS